MAVSRVHIKKSKVSSDADISILNDMFAQMTGTEHADPDIIIPKIIKVTNLLSKYSKMYRMFLNFTEFINSFPEYDIEFKQILEFVDKLDACIDIKISYMAHCENVATTTFFRAEECPGRSGDH